ncbi:hypothetical protein CLCR_04306 [Cladophialophora carrionii]|uniref:Uncharacterized protein n=1 Tax=Cladophialophora carrionii TaxID=86049 RepID=A0A1C1CI02_9EURO|nr:hypothetical protein CLCR_04306 [Cladophialophora carrionii]
MSRSGMDGGPAVGTSWDPQRQPEAVARTSSPNDESDLPIAAGDSGRGHPAAALYGKLALCRYCPVRRISSTTSQKEQWAQILVTMRTTYLFCQAISLLTEPGDVQTEDATEDLEMITRVPLQPRRIFVLQRYEVRSGGTDPGTTHYGSRVGGICQRQALCPCPAQDSRYSSWSSDMMLCEKIVRQTSLGRRSGREMARRTPNSQAPVFGGKAIASLHDDGNRKDEWGRAVTRRNEASTTLNTDPRIKGGL